MRQLFTSAGMLTRCCFLTIKKLKRINCAPWKMAFQQQWYTTRSASTWGSRNWLAFNVFISVLWTELSKSKRTLAYSFPLVFIASLNGLRFNISLQRGRVIQKLSPAAPLCHYLVGLLLTENSSSCTCWRLLSVCLVSLKEH